MIKRILFISIAAIVCLFITAGAWAGPKAVVPEPVYQFENVPEGQKVSHEYVIKNGGDSLLKIVKVSPP